MCDIALMTGTEKCSCPNKKFNASDVIYTHYIHRKATATRKLVPKVKKVLQNAAKAGNFIMSQALDLIPTERLLLVGEVSANFLQIQGFA
jgi:hypothetical protein